MVITSLVESGSECQALKSELGLPGLLPLRAGSPAPAFAARLRETDGRIALIGLPGTGKSAVGRLLARGLDLGFLDLDEAIEEAAGSSIPEVFRERGEAAFRAMEGEALAREASHPRLVLATGGGIVLSEENRRLLRSAFLVVWLHGKPETLARRCSGGGRPLLAGACAEDRIRDLDHQRRALYAECADLVVSTEGRDEEKVAGLLGGLTPVHEAARQELL